VDRETYDWTIETLNATLHNRDVDRRERRPIDTSAISSSIEISLGADVLKSSTA